MQHYWKMLWFGLAIAAAVAAHSLNASAGANEGDDGYHDMPYRDAPTTMSTWERRGFVNHLKKVGLMSPRPRVTATIVPLFKHPRSGVWHAKIQVGTPRGLSRRQTLEPAIDTGSSLSWVPAPETPTPGLFDPTRSKTWRPLNTPFKAQYESGSCEGFTGYDIVNVGGMKVNMTLGAVTKGNRGIVPYGILGLSISPFPGGHPESLFFYAAQKRYPYFDPIAAFCFGTKYQELHLGQVREDAYVGEKIEYHPVIQNDMGYWILGDGKILVGTKIIHSSIQTKLDTGGSLIFGPPDEVKGIYAQISDSYHVERIPSTNDGIEYYGIPCDHKTEVSFKWGDGDPLVILPEDFIKGAVGHKNLCYGAIVGSARLPESSLGGNPEKIWRVGEPFMRRRYVIYDAKNQHVGLAEAKEQCTRK